MKPKAFLWLGLVKPSIFLFNIIPINLRGLEMNNLFSYGDLKKRLGGFLYSPRQWSQQPIDVSDPINGIRGFQVDSRLTKSHDLFFPLKGERTDGHRYLVQVAQQGCKAMLVSREFYHTQATEIKRLIEEYPVVVFPVTDVLGALHTLAREVLNRRTLIKIGVTGSNGKTTTKELIGSILSLSESTFITPGNYNSVIGLPLTIPSIQDSHVYGVFEMAMSEKGEMRRLSDLVFPSIGVLTNLGTAHIGNIGTQMGIAQEKFELFRNFLPDNTAILPEADSYVKKLEPKVRGRKLFFGPNTTPGFQGVVETSYQNQSFRWNNRVVKLSLPGNYNLMNALAAITLALELNIDHDVIQAGLESYNPIFGRSQVIEGRATIILDCYNANPDSMAESLSSFMKSVGQKSHVLVLGDMKELGRFSKREHEDLARRLTESTAKKIILFGPEMKATWQVLEQVASHLDLFWSEDWDEIQRTAQEVINQGDWVFIKGSRSMEMERLVPLVQEQVGVNKC
jgi:UDP-N-acetylmuramoyl-tripeptide--D-alanyl-D-alanine ligase